MLATQDSHELTYAQPHERQRSACTSLGLPAEIVDDYLESLPDTIDQMQTAVEREDYYEVRHLSHRLAGSCGMFGLKALGKTMAKICQAAEYSCQQTITDQLCFASTLCLDATSERPI